MGQTGFLTPTICDIIPIVDPGDNLPLVGWQDTQALIGGTITARCPGSSSSRFQTLSLAFSGFNLGSIPDNNTQMKGIEVIVVAWTPAGKKLAYVRALQLTRRRNRPKREWANKGSAGFLLSENETSMPFGGTEDRWKIKGLKGSKFRKWGQDFGIVLRFATYKPDETVIKFKTIQLNITW